MTYINYKSLLDLNSDIVKGLTKIPRNVDLIVGIPRSGLLAANLIALHLNLPLMDFQSFVMGLQSTGGMRVGSTTKDFDSYRNVLIVDDSLLTGQSMKHVKESIKEKFNDKSITFMAVYIVQECLNEVDLFLEICPYPRIFEWNIMHHDFLSFSCMDIDGILYLDSNIDEESDVVAYQHFIKNTKPLFRPSKRIGCLITNRPERYRKQTVSWLKKNKIEYDNLIMLDLPNKRRRGTMKIHSEYKAMIYIETEASLFIEKYEWQAKKIAELTGKPVYCVDLRMMFH